MSEIRVIVGGQTYLVRGEGSDTSVLVVARHRTAGTALRTLKYGSSQYKAIVKQAKYQRSLPKAGGLT